MALFLYTAPATEPITLAEAKAQCRVDADDEWELFESLIAAAREYVETFTHRALITQVWDYKLDAFPSDSVIWVPKPPMQTVTGSPTITYVDTNGTTQTLSSTLYTVDAPSGPWARQAQIVPAYNETFPSTRDQVNAVTVRFTCGYGTADSVPYGIKAAMKLLIEHWWRNRSAVVTGTTTQMVTGVDALLWPFKSF